MKRLLPLYVSGCFLLSVTAVALRAQGPPTQVPKVGWLWDVVEIEKRVSPTRENWPACGSAASCGSFFVPQHECGVQVYELAKEGTWQPRSAHGEPGTEPALAGFTRDRKAKPDGSGLPGCHVSLRNWSDTARKFLLAWPNQNDSKLPTRQQPLKRLDSKTLIGASTVDRRY